jgi:hypothetical protein
MPDNPRQRQLLTQSTVSVTSIARRRTEERMPAIAGAALAQVEAYDCAVYYSTLSKTRQARQHETNHMSCRVACIVGVDTDTTIMITQTQAIKMSTDGIVSGVSLTTKVYSLLLSCFYTLLAPLQC